MTRAQKAVVAAVGDATLAEYKKGDVLQLERKGYFIVDRPYAGPGGPPMLLFNIPDGRLKNMPGGAVC